MFLVIMKVLFYFVLIFSIIFACDSKVDGNVDILHVDPTRAELGELSEVFSDIKIIALESNDSVLVGAVDDIIIHNDTILILDKNFKSVYIFDIYGKVISMINDYGRGVDEYLSISCIYINENNNIVLVDNSLKKGFEYSLKGEFLKSINFPYSIKTIDVLADGTKIINKDKVDSKNPSGYLLSIQDRSGYEKRFFPHTYVNGSVVYEKNRCITIDSNKIIYSTLDSDTIWVYTANEFLPKFLIDFLGYGIPKELYDEENSMFGERLYNLLLEKEGKIAYWPYVVKIEEEMVEFSYLFMNRLTFCQYNVSNNSFTQFYGPSICGINLRNLTMGQFYVEGQYCFALNNYKLSMLTSREKEKINVKYPQLYNVIQSNKMDDNPILILSKTRYE